MDLEQKKKLNNVLNDISTEIQKLEEFGVGIEGFEMLIYNIYRDEELDEVWEGKIKVHDKETNEVIIAEPHEVAIWLTLIEAKPENIVILGGNYTVKELFDLNKPMSADESTANFI